MTYNQYNWQCKDSSLIWRVAELYARMMIGFTWSLLLIWGLNLLIDTETNIWTSVAMLMILLYGFTLAMPQRVYNDTE